MKNYHPSILNPNEVYTFASRLLLLIKQLITADVSITKILTRLQLALDDLSLAIGRSIDSAAVNLLISKDLIRDNRYIAFRDYCKLCTIDESVTIASAAKFLVEIIKDLGWSMHTEGLSKETALLDALFKKLATSQATAALTTIDAVSRLEALKTAQADFETTYSSKVDKKSKEEYPKIRESRNSVNRYVTALLGYMDVMGEIDGGAYSTACDQIDEVVMEFDTIAHNRQTRNEKEKEESEIKKGGLPK